MPRERGLDYEAGDLSFGGGNGPDMTLDWLTTSEASDTVGGSSHQLLTPPAAMSTTVGAAGGGLAGVSSAGRLSRSVSESWARCWSSTLQPATIIRHPSPFPRVVRNVSE